MLSFGNDISEHVAVITPYRRQFEEYMKMQYKLRQASVNSAGECISPDAQATIRTVVSAQGGEWDVVLLDLTLSKADRIQDIGHMYDYRVCVALTGPKKVLWIISGSMRGRFANRTQADDEDEYSDFKPMIYKKHLRYSRL